MPDIIIPDIVDLLGAGDVELADEGLFEGGSISPRAFDVDDSRVFSGAAIGSDSSESASSAAAAASSASSGRLQRIMKDVCSKIDSITDKGLDAIKKTFGKFEDTHQDCYETYLFDRVIKEILSHTNPFKDIDDSKPISKLSKDAIEKYVDLKFNKKLEPSSFEFDITDSDKIEMISLYSYCKEIHNKIFISTYKSFGWGEIEVISKIIRIGLNFNNFTDYCEKNFCGLLFPEELMVFLSALEFLKTTDLSKTRPVLSQLERSQHYSKLMSGQAEVKTIEIEELLFKGSVVCDFLVRRDGKIVGVGEKDFTGKYKSVEIHSVVLWKYSVDKVMLIDPSNVNFSAFIAEELNFLKALTGFEITTASNLTISKENDKTYKKTITDLLFQKFYQKGDPKAVTGTEITNLRDCVDIAVKICMELDILVNKKTFHNKDGSLKVDSILKSLASDMATSACFIEGEAEERAAARIRGIHSSVENERVNSIATFLRNIHPLAIKDKKSTRR
jgi:hypothetical protein